MKKGIHPVYKEVIFKDISGDFAILTRSTMTSSETMKWENGKEYPVIKIEISSATHPFFTGTDKILDTAGRVERFKRKYANNPAPTKK